MTSSQILKNKIDLNTERVKVVRLLSKASKSKFWGKHLRSSKFDYKKKFTWDDWLRIPYSTKKDLVKIGLEKRILDLKYLLNSDISRFVISTTSGTSRETGPLAVIKNIDCIMDGEEAEHRLVKKPLFLYQSRALSLRNSLATIRKGKLKGRIFEGLFINPFRYEKSMLKIIKAFNSHDIATFPGCVNYLNMIKAPIREIFSPLNTLWMTGDFLNKKQESFIKKTFPSLTLDYDYMMTEVDIIGICCKYIRKKYGTNAYHPYKKRLVEIVDIDENGYGEIVVTKNKPIELSYIRYRTNDIAKFNNELCKCGNEWTFFLAGRRNVDYIKSLGVLITRFELEKVLKKIREIKEWRAEVREVDNKMIMVGELTLKIVVRKKIDIIKLKKKISDNLYLTPNKTLSNLLSEKKFKPLKIEIVEGFAPSSKNVLLRKIYDN